MRRFFIFLVALIIPLLAVGNADACAQQLDSAKRALLDQRITEYFDALKYESADVQKAEADFMIQASSDSLVRQFVALKIYDHYLDSPVMGAEAVAIHVADRWFLSNEINMGDDLALLNARIFADFNRSSLIGETAPELVMETMAGDTLKIFSDQSRTARKGDRHSVLLFYDADCAKCKVQTILLSNLLSTEDYPIDFYAIYTGDDRTEWEKYVNERLEFEAPHTRVVHLWDPTFDSDYQRKYGVIQTPRMFLVRPDGVIKGRGLDTFALSKMMDQIFSVPALEYGRPESEEYFDRLLAMTQSQEGKPSKEDISSISDYLAAGALQAGDTTMCRQFIGDFLYYLAPKTGEWVKEGTRYIIDEYISGRDDIWKTEDDSLKIIGFAQILDDLLSKSAPGSRISDLKVPGELLRSGKKIKSGEFCLRKLKGDVNIIIFYTEGCHICDAEKAAARTMVAENQHYAVLMVNVDAVVASSPQLASRLFDVFDLSSLPFIIKTDKKGKIIGRYLSLQ